MLGKEWSALLKLIQDVSAVFSIVINTFLIALILTKSPKQLGAYKWLMIYISVFEIFYSILDVVLVPQHYSHGPTFLVIVGLKDKLFGPAGLLILNSCYWGCFGASMAVFAVHFVYRWLVVTEHPLLETFNGWKIWIWFSVPMWYGLTWICTGYILSAPNEHTSRFIKDNVKEIFDLEFDEYVYLGPFLYEKTDNGTIDVHIVPFIGLGIISGTIVSSIIIVLVFGILCYQKINKLVATTAASAKLIKLQRQLFYALVIQTLVPFILMHIPAAIMFAFVFLDIDLGVYSAVVSMTIAIYPAVDPIPTLVIVENYRKTIIRIKMHTKVYVSEDRTKVFVLFYEAACVFSNFYPSGFEAKPVENFLKDTEKKEKLLKFTCSEQYFMYNKALLVGDMDIAEQILKETNPMKMKLLGRKLSMTKEQLKLWSQKSKDVMYRACLEKFSQNEDCRMILFRTHGMKLVEASPTDKIWGIGLDKADQRCEDERNWRGSNWLGEVLDQVREELWTRQEFKSNREQILKESLETRCQILEHFSH